MKISETTAQNTFESISIGDTFEYYRYISEEDVRDFARLTGDNNPIHLDAEYAAGERFGDRIVHGVFLLSLFSKVLGSDFPGPGSVAVSIYCRFLRPVLVNTTVRVEVVISRKLEKRRQIKARTYFYNEANKMAGAGEAILVPPGEDAI